MATSATTGAADEIPKGACDCHFHVYGPADRYPYAADRPYTPEDALPESYFALMHRLGIERGVLVQPSVYGTDNTLLADLLLSQPGRLRGVAALGLEVDDREIERLHLAGVRGVRINPRLETPIKLRDLPAFAARIAGLGWHIELIVNVSRLPVILTSLENLPVPLVFAHMGYDRDGAQAWSQGRQAEGLDLMFSLLRGGNCWVKLSGAYYVSSDGSPYDDVLALTQALAEAAPDRAVWGTDWPHPNLEGPSPDDRQLLDLLCRALPDPKVRQAVLVDNPTRLYGF